MMQDPQYYGKNAERDLLLCVQAVHAEVGRYQKRFWALPVIGAARRWYQSTRKMRLPISML